MWIQDIIWEDDIFPCWENNYSSWVFLWLLCRKQATKNDTVMDNHTKKIKANESLYFISCEFIWMCWLNYGSFRCTKFTNITMSLKYINYVFTLLLNWCFRITGKNINSPTHFLGRIILKQWCVSVVILWGLRRRQREWRWGWLKIQIKIKSNYNLFITIYHFLGKRLLQDQLPKTYCLPDIKTTIMNLMRSLLEKLRKLK